MYFSATVLALLAAVATQATSVHNQWGHNGWIQDRAGTDIYLGNGKTVTVAGGWGFFWVDSNVCADNAAAFSWPEGYGDVYIKGDGFLHDSNGNRINSAHLC